MARIYRYILKARGLFSEQLLSLIEHRHLLLALFATVILLALPTFGNLWKLWQLNKAFDGLMLVPFMSLLLFNKTRVQLSSIKINLSLVSIIYVLISLIFMVLLNLSGFVRLSGYFFIVSLFFVFNAGFGFETKKSWLGSLVFLGLMVPVSLDVLNIVTFFLQHLFAFAVEIFSPIFSCELLVRDGFDFYFENCPHLMAIAPECSGFQSLTGFVVMATFFGVVDRHDKLSFGVLFTVGVLSALVLNFLRIALTVQLRLTELEEYSIGRWHGFLGIAVFIVGCLFLSKFSRFLKD